MQISLEEETQGIITADPGLDPELFQRQFCEMIGLPESVPVAKAVEQLIGDWYPAIPENQEPINFILAQVASHNPRSMLEAQLLVQMLICHRLCMRMMKKASNETWPENIDKYTNTAMKLSRGFKSGMESLAKYRRDGKQYLYIERINVEKDGQAVIGNVSREGVQ